MLCLITAIVFKLSSNKELTYASDVTIYKVLEGILSHLTLKRILEGKQIKIIQMF